MSRDRIDLTDVVARAKSAYISFPLTKSHRIDLMQRIAKAIQERQGHFYFSQIHLVLEMSYPDAIMARESEIVEEIDNWLSNDPNAEFLGEEGMFYAYRLR